jgi:hypothetical protein
MIKGLNPYAGNRREKLAKIVFTWSAKVDLVALGRMIN